MRARAGYLLALGLALFALVVSSASAQPAPAMTQGGGGGGAAFPHCGPGTSLPIGSVIVVVGIGGAWRCVAPNTFAPA